MRIILLLILFIGVSQQCFAQDRNMKVHLKDGTTLLFPIDSIEKMDVGKQLPTWQYNVVKIFSNQTIPYGISYPFESNSLRFDHDSLLVTDNNGNKNARYIIQNDRTPKGPGIDSISILQFERDTNIISYRDYTFTGCHRSNSSGLFNNLSWVGDKIYTGFPLGYFKVDPNDFPYYRIGNILP